MTMNPLVQRYRKVKKAVDTLRGYLEFDPSNEIVRRTDFNTCPRPVLLLCGFLSTRRQFEVLEKRLRRDGYGVWSINLGIGGLRDAYNTRGIEECAALVREKVERLYARYPRLGPLSIIGPSQGGVIGHYYVKRRGGDARTCSLITLGTPHRGTPVAYLGCALMGAVSRSVWQMRPGASFLKRLHIGAFPRNVRLVSIYSRADQVGRYPGCLLEEDGESQGVNLELANVTHREFVYKKSVYDVIRRELSSGYGERLASPRLRALPQTTKG